jgi:scyllo-inositol 2-dehydrogenase (NADP+)
MCCAIVFHAPLVSTTPGMRLAAFVNRSGPTAALTQKYPDAAVFASIDQLLLDPSIHLVIITTPNTLHHIQARQALEAGKHVVVEKPFTITFEQAIELAKFAQSKSLVLSVFHNRRWDADFLTVQKLVQAQNSTLGRLVSFESRFDRFRNFSKNGWRETGLVEEGSGVLYDLCSHLLDQALVLFGEPESLTAHVSNQRQLASSQVDDQFLVHLDYKDGFRCTLGAGMLARIPTPRYRLTGMNGSFVKYGLDVQENQLKEGLTPKNGSYGLEKEENWGELDTVLDVEGVQIHVKGKVDSEQGTYGSFYRNVKDAIQGTEKLSVTAEQAAWVIHGIQLAIKSSQSGQRVNWHQ